MNISLTCNILDQYGIPSCKQDHHKGLLPNVSHSYILQGSYRNHVYILNSVNNIYLYIFSN